MTGHAMFNEVFLSDARVPAAAVIGDENNGWAVANTTLMHERAGLGSGGGSAGYGGALPGTVAGQLQRRVGEFVSPDRSRRGGGGGGGTAAVRGGSAQLLIGLAKGNGKSKDPLIRQGLAQLYTMGEIGRFNVERGKAARAAGTDVPGLPNIGKLSMSQIVKLSRDLGLQIVGPQGMLHSYTDGESRKTLDEATGNPFLGAITESALYAQAPSIYGGTDQIQRNIIGERVLGLPKEPNDDKTRPFSELPKNG
jgi:alkylation response protein AidB-like acyl-CoA dehydrogenase